MDNGEVWTKTCGPWFIYLNRVPASVKDPKQAAQLLFKDAQAQADAEAKAWPYRWFKDEHFVPASGRGMVKGKIRHQGPRQSERVGRGLWVGCKSSRRLTRASTTSRSGRRHTNGGCKTEADGSFTIPHVIAGEKYLLWAFGPGAAGTFLSHKLDGGTAAVRM